MQCAQGAVWLSIDYLMHPYTQGTKHRSMCAYMPSSINARTCPRNVINLWPIYAHRCMHVVYLEP